MSEIGDVLAGKYRLERLIGSGGFAAVYAARNVLIDRPVALKMLHSTVAQNKVVVERFLREARLASKNIHPTIVRVEDIGQREGGEPFLIMELLEGRNLADEMEEKGAMPLPRALSIGTSMLEGLAAAHANGIIHRDFKPANIFLVSPGFPDPPVRILDLGMAKDLSDQHLLTVSGDVIGTPSYLAPEILLNPSDTLWIPALDVYSMGMLLFYMLTGRLPFDQGEAESGYMAVLHRMDYYKSVSELKGPTEFAPHVPASIDAVIRRALSIPPEGRYHDANEMLAAFKDAQANIGPSVVRSSEPPPSQRTFSLEEDIEELDSDALFEDSLEFDATDDDEATKQWTTAELFAAMKRMDSDNIGTPIEDLDDDPTAPSGHPSPSAPSALPSSSAPAPATPSGYPSTAPDPATPRSPSGGLEIVPSADQMDALEPEAPRYSVKAKPRGLRKPQPVNNRAYLAATLLLILLILAAVVMFVLVRISLFTVHPMVPALLGGWAGLSTMALLLTVVLWVLARRRA